VTAAAGGLTVYQGFASLPAAVRAVLSGGPGRDFFTTLEWFDCLRRHGIAEPVTPRVLAVRQPGGAVLSALVTRARGGRLESFTNYYATRFGMALAPGVPPATAARLLAEGLKGHEPACDGLELRYLRADVPATAALAAALADAGFSVAPFFQYVNRYAAVPPGDFAAYMAERPSRLRNTWSRRGRQAAARHRVRYRVLTAPGAPLEAGIDAFQRVYARSWKGAEPRPGFMPALIRMTCRFGSGRLGVLWLDDAPAAVQFWLVSDRTALIYKLAYDPAFADLSPGTLLSAEMFRYAIDTDRVAEVDFGLGDEPYKRDWVDRGREIVGIEAANPATAAGRWHIARRQVRDALRRLGLRGHRPARL